MGMGEASAPSREAGSEHAGLSSGGRSREWPGASSSAGWLAELGRAAGTALPLAVPECDKDGVAFSDDAAAVMASPPKGFLFNASAFALS